MMLFWTCTRAGPEPVALAPSPVRLAVWGLLRALSIMFSAPARDPMAEGVNVTLIPQLAPIARLVPQLFVWAKSPLAAMLETVSGALPELVRVSACAALVVPTCCDPKVRLVEESVTAGAGPVVPKRLTDSVPSEASVT